MKTCLSVNQLTPPALRSGFVNPHSLGASSLPSLACLTLIAGLVGCGGGNGAGAAALDAKSAHDSGKGTVRVYDASVEQAWVAAHAAMKWNDVGVAQDHADEHYLISDPVRYDQIGIWVNAEGADKTRVSVVVIDEPNLPGPNEEGVQKDIAAAIGQIKSGLPTDKRPK